MFCTAVATQMLQVQSLSLPLWISLVAAAVSISSGVAYLIVTLEHPFGDFATMTPYSEALSYVFTFGTFVCATAMFWHVSGMVGALFVVWSGVTLLIARGHTRCVHEEAEEKNLASTDRDP